MPCEATGPASYLFWQGKASTRQLNSSDLVEACQLVPQPLSLLDPAVTPSTLYTAGATPLTAEIGLSPLFDLEAVGSPSALQLDHVSHVLDWWPEEAAPMPVGYHITAPMLPVELAPVGFDSHYAWDSGSRVIHYVHSGLRNASLLGKYLGAGGLCRAHAVGMPLFDANTNRFCTREPLSNKDTPHLPIELPFMLPQQQANLLKQYSPQQQCAASAEEVPWVRVSPLQSAGSPELPLLMDSSGTAQYNGGTFPMPQATVMHPLRGLYSEWGPSCQGVRWGISPPCRSRFLWI
jgi:hypothetical protein